MERVFYVSGLKPYAGKSVNDLLKACDLGVSGAFVKFAEGITMTVDDDSTPEQLKKQPGALEEAYLQLGYKKIIIREV